MVRYDLLYTFRWLFYNSGAIHKNILLEYNYLSTNAFKTRYSRSKGRYILDRLKVIEF